jgi:CHAT domain-containing protein
VPGFIDLIKHPGQVVGLLSGDCFVTVCPNGHANTTNVAILVRRDDGVLFYLPGDGVGEQENDATLYAILGGLPQEVIREVSDAEGRIPMEPLVHRLLPVALSESVTIRSLLTPGRVLGPEDLKEARRLAPEVLDLLADLMATQYAYGGNLMALESAIRLSGLAVVNTPEEDPNYSAHLGNLAGNLSRRYSATRRGADLEQAIAYATAALDKTPERSSRRADFHNNLAEHLFERFGLNSTPSDLDAAIGHAEATLGLTDADDERRAPHLSNLATYLATRFRLRGKAADLDAAIDYADAAICISASDALERPSILNTLALCLSYRFDATGSRDDLERAIVATQGALDLLPDGHVDRPVLLNNLANDLSARFLLTGAIADFDAAIGFAENAVAASSDDDANRPMYLGNLANRLASRFAASGHGNDLNDAIRHAEAAVRLAPEGHEKRRAYLGNLATHLSTRFKASGDVADLDAAIRYGQAAVDATPDTHGERSTHLNNLASHLSMRYAVRGTRADLDAAIAHAEAALELTHPRAASRAMVLGNLAGYLDARFTLTGGRGAIDRAVDCAQAALALTPEDHAERPAYLNNLANFLVSRARVSGAVADVDAAVTHARAALALQTDNLVEQAGRHNTLSNVLAERYRLTEDAGDLDASITHAGTAVELSPVGHTGRLGRLNNLANRLAQRFRRTSNKADIDAAIEAAGRVVAETPAGHRDMTGFLNNLAAHLEDRYRATGARADLEAALTHAQAALLGWQRRALESEDARAILARAGESARRVLALLLAIGAPARLVAALETGKAVRLRVELAGSGRSPGHLDAAGQAAYQRIRSELRLLGGELRALDDLPDGARVASHAAAVARLRAREAELRSARERLEAGDPAFRAAALDYAAVRAKVTEAGEATVYLQPLDDPSENLLALIVHPASPERGPLADDMLEIAGFGRAAVRRLLFTQSDKLNAADSFLPAPGKPLGWLTADWAAKEEESEAADHRLLDTLARVVDDLGGLMAPIARRLRRLGIARVVLVPGECLGLLPLHAGRVVADGRPFGEEFETRYAPSATALYAAQPPVHAAAGYRLVGVANPDGSLPFADMQMRRVAALFGGTSLVAHGRKAGRAWLLSEVGNGDVVALATHARFAMNRPETSWFVLAHPRGRVATSARRAVREAVQAECEKLSLDDILRGALHLTPGALVVADACETGQMATGAAAEEFVGFPAAFLASGASAVIASLWSVTDVSTALLMEEMYRRLNAGDPPERALQQAAAWLRQVPRDVVKRRLMDEISAVASPTDNEAERLRNALQDALTRLIDGPRRPFAHPFFWAAFAVHGRGQGQPAREAPWGWRWRDVLPRVFGCGS